MTKNSHKLSKCLACLIFFLSFAFFFASFDGLKNYHFIIRAEQLVKQILSDNLDSDNVRVWHWSMFSSGIQIAIHLPAGWPNKRDLLRCYLRRSDRFQNRIIDSVSQCGFCKHRQQRTTSILSGRFGSTQFHPIQPIQAMQTHLSWTVFLISHQIWLNKREIVNHPALSGRLAECGPFCARNESAVESFKHLQLEFLFVINQLSRLICFIPKRWPNRE